MTCGHRINRIGVICVTVVICCAVPMAAPAGDTLLYNGIVLPKAWPPREPFRAGEPMRVPYLENPPAVIPIDVGRQLFVDDFLIDATTLTRTFHGATWHPASPVLGPDRPWESPHEAVPFSDGVWYDPDAKQFVLWYQSGPELTCRATSRDGFHWEKPTLDVEPGTNIVMRHIKRDSATIWFDQNDPDPRRRYKALVFSKAPPRGLWLYASADGIHWGKPMVQSKNIGDRSTFFYNPFRQRWVFSLRIGMTPPGTPRARVYREHSDVLAGLQWREKDGLTQQTDDLYPWVGADRLDPRHPDPRFAQIIPQLYNLDAVAYESLLLGLFSVWQGPENDDCTRLGVAKRNEVLLGFSRDGFHWHRPDRRPFLACNADQKAWNHANVQSVGGGCLIVGDRLFFYASGRRPIDAKGTTHDTTGLATLRRDGFASMDAKDSPGTLTTRPVRFSGRHLFVNVECPDGQLQVEVLDTQGRTIEPFARDRCRPIRADAASLGVEWQGAADLGVLAGRPVRFRFHLRRGRLYRFWVAPTRSGASRGYVAAGGPGLVGAIDTHGIDPIAQATDPHLVNEHLDLSFVPSQGDHPQRIVARHLREPRPFGGSLSAGPVFVQQLLVDGQAVPKLATKITSKSATQIELQSAHGGLNIVRRYSVEPRVAGYSDEITYHNRGAKPVVLRVGQTGDVSGNRDEGPKWNRWAWPSMRWFLADGTNFITQPVHFMMPELAANKEPLTRTIHRNGNAPLQFGFVDGQALGLLADARVDGPVELKVLFDRFPPAASGQTRRNEIWTRWSWQTARDMVLKPGDRLVVKQHVMLLSGQGRVDAWDGDGVAAALDAPAYRDSGEPIEAAGRLTSDRAQRVKLKWLAQAGPSADWREHAVRDIDLPAGSTVDVALTNLAAAEPFTRLALVVENASGKRLRVEKTVLAGQSDAAADRLRKEYHRRFPAAVDFEGTLEEFGRGLMKASRRMRVADGFSPDVQLRWSQTESGAAERLRASRPGTNDRREAAAVLAAYRRWFPNYSKVLDGKAAAIGSTPELLALDEQARFDRVTLDDPAVQNRFLGVDIGCLDVAFRHSRGVYLAWNKERWAVNKGVPLAYERYRFRNGPSFHAIANYGINEAGLAVVGASLNPHPTVVAEAIRAVRLRRAEGKAFAPPDPLLLLLLECQTVEDAVRLIENPDAPPVWLAGCLIADRKGNAAVWQSAGTLQYVRRADDGWRTMTNTNYPLAWTRNDPVEPSMPGRSTLNGLWREANLTRLATEFCQRPVLADVFRVMRDRSEPGAIEQEHANAPGAHLTVLSMVADTATGDLHISHSPPSSHKYHCYPLQDRMATDTIGK